MPSSRTVLLSFVTAVFAVACRAESTPEATAGGELNSVSIEEGQFDMSEQEGWHHATFRCEHYLALELENGPRGPFASFEGAINEACRDGGEQLAAPTGHEYLLREVETDECGSVVYEGSVPWTDAVTRTLRIHDNRRCATATSRIVLEESRTLRGETGKITTYYSADPR